MKKLLIVLFSVGLALGASAQKVVRGGGGVHYSRPRVVVGVGAGFGYSPFYSPYGLYSPWGYPPYAYNNYGYNNRPSRLDLEVQDIKVDYADRIKSVKMDDSLTGKQKRNKVRELKTERDRAIIQAKKDYYYNRSQSNRPSNNNNNNNNDNR